VQRGLDDGRGMMGSRRLGAPSGAMVALMVGQLSLWSNILEMNCDRGGG
jgi:hypothetical protein